MECIIPLDFLINNAKTEKMKKKAERARKVKEELLMIIMRERQKLSDRPEGYTYLLGDERNVSPTKKRIKEEKNWNKYSNLTRAKSARLIRDLRNRQKSKSQLLRDLGNFHKYCKHKVRYDHQAEKVKYDANNFDEAKSANIFLERMRDHRRSGYLSPSARSRLPRTTRKERNIQRARSALPLKFDRRPSQIQTDRPHRNKKHGNSRALSPGKANFSINLHQTEPETQIPTGGENSPGYSVKLSYSHYNPFNNDKEKNISPRSKFRKKKKMILDAEKKKVRKLKKKQAKKKRKKILKFVYQDRQGVSPIKSGRRGINSAIKKVNISQNV